MDTIENDKGVVELILLISCLKKWQTTLRLLFKTIFKIYYFKKFIYYAKTRILSLKFFAEGDHTFQFVLALHYFSWYFIFFNVLMSKINK
jgi:hypothetical protein